MAATHGSAWPASISPRWANGWRPARGSRAVCPASHTLLYRTRRPGPGSTSFLGRRRRPGASTSPTWGKYNVFKGNYTEGGHSKTGVYCRNALGGAGTRRTYLNANTNTRISNQASCGNATFGSTAPPSAAAGKAVFLGTDNEDAATLGGIYLAKLLRPRPTAKVRTVLVADSDAHRLDPKAPAGSLVTVLGIERDGFRGCKLTLNASMLNAATSESWAGVYVLKCGACSG